MEEAGLAVCRDAAGNVLGRLGEPEEPPLVLGSHLDTVPDAGRFDGPLGVLAGIAVAGRVQARGLAPSLEVAAFADEEGARFGVPYLGSAAYAGVFEPAWLKLVDDDGVTVAEAVRAAGGDPDGLVDVPSPQLAGYLEAHIEQGPVLEAGTCRSASLGDRGADARAGHPGGARGARGDDADAGAPGRARGRERDRARGRAVRARRGGARCNRRHAGRRARCDERRPRPGAALGRRPPR